MSRGALMTAVHIAPVYFAQFTVDELNEMKALMKQGIYQTHLPEINWKPVDVLYESWKENQGPFQKLLP